MNVPKKLQTASSLFETRWKVSLMICCCSVSVYQVKNFESRGFPWLLNTRVALIIVATKKRREGMRVSGINWSMPVVRLSDRSISNHCYAWRRLHDDFYILDVACSWKLIWLNIRKLNRDWVKEKQQLVNDEKWNHYFWEKQVRCCEVA